jgi:Tol biopolymer transport system component
MSQGHKYILVLFLACAAALACGRWEGRGGEAHLAFEWEEFGEVPGATPLIFAPGLLPDGLSAHGYPAFSPEGREVYWSAYAGSFRNQQIYCMRYESGTWTPPEVADFSGEFAEGCPVFSPDGEVLYFNSARPLGADDEGGKGYVWLLERKIMGWDGPRGLGAGVNSGRVSMQVAPAKSGCIYFAAWRDEERADSDIYVSMPVGEDFGEPDRLGEEINSTYQDITPCISADESYMVFASIGRPGCRGGADLYVSFRGADGAWTESVNLGDRVNTPAMEAFCGLSPDGRFLFFNSDRDGADRVWWVSTAVINSLRPVVQAR